MARCLITWARNSRMHYRKEAVWCFGKWFTGKPCILPSMWISLWQINTAPEYAHHKLFSLTSMASFSMIMRCHTLTSLQKWFEENYFDSKFPRYPFDQVAFVCAEKTSLIHEGCTSWPAGLKGSAAKTTFRPCWVHSSTGHICFSTKRGTYTALSSWF